MTESLCDHVRQMSDAELVTSAAQIRGTSKRGARRRLTEAETLALAAILDEQTRRNPHHPFPDARSRWAYGCGKDTLNG